MKSQSFLGSVNHGSKELYTSTNQEIVASNGDFIKIGSNEVFYQVEDYKPLNLKKKYECHGKYITIKGDYTFKISRGDNAQLYFTEYEAVNVNKILGGPEKYTFGETFYAQGGTPSSSRENLTGKYTELKVAAVNKDGTIQTLEIADGGKYLSPPENPITARDTEGKPLQVELEFDYSSDSSVFERDFTVVEYKDGKTHLHLSYPFPKEIKEGELILSKQVVYLNKEYGASPQIHATCQTTGDFSPINKIPLVPPNAVAPHAIYNKAVEIVDNRLAEIERRLIKLENRN
jgi:hypothetical protein|tara:strand:+ start:17705 stop:18571 length:867 start_codon:yes stop_codon:yes gene_type:complete